MGWGGGDYFARYAARDDLRLVWARRRRRAMGRAMGMG